jgi:hypothetical protein
MVAPRIVVGRQSGLSALAKRVAGLTKLEALVGIPGSQTARNKQLRAMADKTTGKRKRAKLLKAAESDVTNAELLFVLSKGSPKRNIPARPVLEPAVSAPDNAKKISHELAESNRASLHGDKRVAQQRMARAGLAGQNAARNWFTDDRNEWEPNAPSTIARKGSERPNIDTGAMRAAITYVVREGS